MVFGIQIVVEAFIMILLYLLKYADLLDVYPFYTRDHFTAPWLFILFLVSIIPIIDELVFHLHLRLSSKNILFSFSIGMLYIVTLLNIRLTNPTFITIIIIILLLVYFFIKKKLNKKIENIWQKHFPIVFYCSSILFGILHVLYSNNAFSTIYWIPILLVPQITLGINTGYLRVIQGFKWGVLLHIMYNVLIVIISIQLNLPNDSVKMKAAIIVNYPEKNYNPKHYKLKIESREDFTFNTSKISPTEVFFEYITIKEAFCKLSNSKESEVYFENSKIANQTIQLHFSYTHGKELKIKATRQFILKELLKHFKLKAQSYIIPKETWVLTSNRENNKTSIAFNSKKEKNNIVSGKKVVYQNITLPELAQKLKELYQIDCIAISNKNTSYNLTIPNNDILTLQHTLLNNYDLQLSKTNNLKFIYCTRSKK